jgi:signal transduction histidine kinase
MQTTIETCDGVELARSVITTAQNYIPPGIKLQIKAPKKAPLIAADPDKARQVLTNLVDNAVKYSPDGGKVSIEITLEGSRMRFAVHDKGLGVPPPEHRRIFEKFYRLDPDLTRGVGGTGLGLYICRRMAEAIGARLWLAKSDESGSDFCLFVPERAPLPDPADPQSMTASVWPVSTT